MIKAKGIDMSPKVGAVLFTIAMVVASIALFVPGLLTCLIRNGMSPIRYCRHFGNTFVDGCREARRIWRNGDVTGHRLIYGYDR